MENTFPILIASDDPQQRAAAARRLGEAGFEVLEISTSADRVEADRKIVQQNLHMQLAQQMARIGYWSFDVASGMPTWSEMMFSVLGCDPAQGVPHYDEHRRFIHPDDWEAFDRGVQGAIAGTPYHVELRVVFPDESIHYVMTQGYPQRDEDGQIRSLFGTTQDITERRRAEEALRRSEADLRAAQRFSHVGSWAWHIRENRLEWSDEMYRVFGLDPAGFSGDLAEVIAGAIHPEDRAAVEQSNLGVIERGEPSPLAYRVIWPDGSIHTVWAEAGELILDEEGRPAVLKGYAQDITERRRIEQALKDYSERLEEMVEARTRELAEAQEQLLRRERLAALGQLAGGVGHELRNPLGVISNAVYLLTTVLTPGGLPAGDDGAQTTHEYLEIISAEVRNAEKIVRDLLDFGRVQLPDRDQVPVAALVSRALERSPAPAGVRVATELPADLPAVTVDPLQIGLVLNNLLSNACEAMPDGGRLTISARAEGGGVLLSVADTGGGIAPEHRTRIFEPLFTTKARGIGLGLALSKSLVEANGGRIEVESALGEGSTFGVYLPGAEVAG